MPRPSRTQTIVIAGLTALMLVIAGAVIANRFVTQAAQTEEQALAATALRPPGGSEQFYFVMTDRFANGDPANDRGGLTGGRGVTGFDPSDKGFYHGGDLKGLQDKLDYIRGLGTTAIWLTPSFKNKPVQGSSADVSAGYHGYWITDFTQVDPHLGTNDDMKALIEAAHGKGMRVFFDIITNHTADVIAYEGGGNTYISKAERPYRDASGAAFDDVDYVGKDAFPTTDPAKTAPYVPTIPAAEKALKVPGWLNDPMMYHNRGDSTWEGESNTYGDFMGLDDLWTERPEVVKGMIDIYRAWIDFGIDGFRIDTVKHVNLGFWQQFGPAIKEYAASKGKPNFFAFAEVYTAQPSARALYSTAGKLPATLDFGFQEKARDFALGQSASGLADLFAADDTFTDADSNASFQPTFLGNHDMGRIGMFLAASSEGEELLARDKLAHAVMFLTRGQPVVYYGDEQGFIGMAGDKDARQDMFATKVAEFADQPVIGAESGARDRFDTTHPLYRWIASLGALRREHPALATGAMIPRAVDDTTYAISRIDAARGIEYVVAFNNSTSPVQVSLRTASLDTEFAPVLGGTAARTDADGTLSQSVPALGVVVLKAATPMPASPGQLTTPLAAGSALDRRPTVTAAWSGTAPVQVTFLAKPAAATTWTVLGVDDSPDYAVTADLTSLPAGPLEVKILARSYAGEVTATTVPVSLS